MIANALLLIVLLFLSGFFSGAEVVLLSVSPLRVRTFVKKKRHGSASLNRLKNHPRRMIITILIGNNVVNITAATLTTILAAETFDSAGVGIAAGVLTIAILIFGEIIPKTVASAHAARLSLLIAPIIELLMYVLYPVVLLLEWLTAQVQRLIRFKKTAQFTEADIKSLIELSVENHILEPQERDILNRVLKFNDITAYEVMTPFGQVQCLPATVRIHEVLDTVVDAHFSRFPLVDKKGARIVGIVLVKDILRALQRGHTADTLQDIATDAVMVSRRMAIDDVFQLMQDRQTHLVIVHDKQHDKTLGIVTLEDLLEELVGEITDETDVAPGKIIRVNKTTIVTHGDTQVARINRFFNTQLPLDTKDARLHSFLKSLVPDPATGSTATYTDLQFHIESIHHGRITKVRIVREEKR